MGKAKIKQPLKKGFIFTYKIQLLVITVLVFFLYARTIQYDFVDVDDTTLIVDNYKFIHNMGNLKAAFVHDVFYNPQNPSSKNVYYRPVMTLSLMLDSQAGTQSPRFYHFMNILFHLVSCFLLFRFLILLRYRSETAFAGTILFAVHPILSQAIGWIPGRNDSLLTLFILAGMINFIQYIDTSRRSKLWLHLLFFALALFTKETALFLPIIAWLSYFLILKQGKIGNKYIFKKQDAYLLVTGYLLVILSWFLLRANAIAHAPVDLSFNSLGTTFLGNLPIYIQLIQKIIIPYNLSILSIVKDTNFIIGITVIIILAVLIYLSKQRRNQYILLGVIWFTVFLLPAFTVPVLTGFEHRAYLPFIGFLLIIFEIDYFKKLNYAKPVSFAFIATVSAIYVVINFYHTPAFASHFAFWEKAATNSPNSSLSKLNYGYALWEQGKTDEALKAYNEGLAINPTQPMIHNDLGILYGQEKKYEEAEKEFKEENQINPSYSAAYYNLGILYEMMQNEDEMVGAWKEAISVDSNNIQAKTALDNYYRKKMRLQ